MASFLTNSRDVDEFGVEIEFQRNTPAPTRVFRAMSAYIESFEFIDAALLSSVTTRIQPTLLLEDVEAGSIIAWLRNTLESIDDEALKSGDYKKLIGAYLVRGKKAIIDFIDKRTTVQSQAEIAALQTELLQIAEETDALRIPTYRPVPSIDIAQSLKALGEASAVFLRGDRAKYLSQESESNINISFSISPKQIDELLVREQIPNEAAVILRVKKPDFLGDSMWDFVHDGRTLSMRLADTEWLGRFRQGKEVIFPGDSLRALVRTTVGYGFDNQVVSTHYEIIKVFKILRNELPTQIALHPE